uniref:Uncharacterized protein n=1 Tax=Nelumbo nucifera TaxID=4432 RepID=A0A822ZAV4_NELNU|nr:TPA_asm: hypothetical protein HUJ06_012970 [Nelumbo nucifera]
MLRLLSCKCVLEAFQVHGLPCAYNFHVECIDEWILLNVKYLHYCSAFVKPMLVILYFRLGTFLLLCSKQAF